MTFLQWYDSLAKPWWTPAPSTISFIWTLLYPIIVLTFGYVFVQAFRGKIPWKIASLFAINLVANLLFMPIFAGLRHVSLAAVDILIVWASLLGCIAAIWPFARWVAIAQAPYFLWVSIAMVLQMAIVAMNWNS
ncbi:MAG: TspO/MBR family protein [Planctomycetota bacterium]